MSGTWIAKMYRSCTKRLPNTLIIMMQRRQNPGAQGYSQHTRLAEFFSRSGATDVQRAEAFLRDRLAAYIYMDDDTIAEAVVFQTRKLRRLFSAFSDVMMVNIAFGTNRNRYKLFSFLVHNFNGKEQYVQHSCWQQKHEQI
ncbi:hypothetical protein GQ600_6550 [Phytophthora cactorum]|nr:hypothetical protein GQ600_6550 [Phytophthora cactorum]